MARGFAKGLQFELIRSGVARVTDGRLSLSARRVENDVFWETILVIDGIASCRYDFMHAPRIAKSRSARRGGFPTRVVGSSDSGQFWLKDNTTSQSIDKCINPATTRHE